MKYLVVVSMLSLCLLGQKTIAQDDFPPCIPLNEALSICTNIEGLDVSFIDATPTAAMGGVSLWERQDINYVWAAYWEIDATLQDYSREQAQSVLEYSSGYELQEPIATKAGGFPGVWYDLFVEAGAGEKLPPKSILFLDTPGGFVIFNGYALEPDVEVKDIHDGAISAVQILKVGK